MNIADNVRCLAAAKSKLATVAALLIIFVNFLIPYFALNRFVSKSVHHMTYVRRYDELQHRFVVETEEYIRFREDAVRNAEMFLEKQDPPYLKTMLSFQLGSPNPNRPSFDDIAPGVNKTDFSIYRDDVLVVLHIQKTGGTTLEHYLTRNLNISSPCTCLLGAPGCACFRPDNRSSTVVRRLLSSRVAFNVATILSDQWKFAKYLGLKHWLFSRFSPGWFCGVHSDWTELITGGCVDAALNAMDGQKVTRRHFIVTMLREPIARTISEFGERKHWGSPHICKGRIASPNDLPYCVRGSNWKYATLDDFLGCPHNMAFNRQTRMLADLTLVDCYNTSFVNQDERERIMLKSAKENLASMKFFGLLEEMELTEKLFTMTFGLRFTRPFKAMNARNGRDPAISNEQLAVIKMKNNLDIELYEYAKVIFRKRVRRLKLDITKMPQIT